MSNYNQFAKEYKTFSRRARASGNNDPLYSLLTDIKGKRLLDVGCGAGTDAKVYSAMGAKVSGIDISENQVKLARREVKGTFVAGDMAKLPFEDNSFDMVVSRYAIQASRNVRKSILEMVRVAKPNSEIIILTKHPLRTFLEGYINDKKLDYFKKGIVTSYLFNRKIKLSEPSHAFEEYFDKEILDRTRLELFKEGSDFPGSERVLKGLTYPTYMVLKLRKLHT